MKTHPFGVQSWLANSALILAILGIVFTLFVFSMDKAAAQAVPFSVSCYASPSNVSPGNQVSWYANASGGNGNYSYSWNGTDNLSGSNQTVSHQYYGLGQQSATVTVFSNGQSMSSTCYANVSYQNGNNGGNNGNNNGPLSATCTAYPQNANINDQVNWIVQNASGGNGNYYYSWSGTDGLYGTGSSVLKSYQYGGQKTAAVTISSNGQQYVASCSTYVNGNGYNNGNNYNNRNNGGQLSVSCYGTPSNANVGDQVNWNATISGGYGNLTYSWTGTDGLSYGNASSIGKVYLIPGTKTATVTANANGQIVTQSCSVNVGGSYTNYTNYVTPNQTYFDYPSRGTPVSGVYLSQIPATGISFNLKTILFLIGLTMWSLFGAYLITEKKKLAR